MTVAADLVPVENMAALEELSAEARDLAVTQMLDQAHHWLAHAKEASAPAREIADFKAFVASAADAARRVKVSKEIQLDADEMVRRSERVLGVAIRTGQESGDIRKTGQRGKPQRTFERVRNGKRELVQGASSDTTSSLKPSPVDFATPAELSSNGAGIYDLVDDVSDEDFDEALNEAKSEGNLSRANVVRKVKGRTNQSDARLERAKRIREMAASGHTSRQMASTLSVHIDTIKNIAKAYQIEIPADKITARTRHIDSTRVARQTVFALEGAAAGLELIDFEDIDDTEIADWAASLSDSMRALNRFVKQIKEMAQ